MDIIIILMIFIFGIIVGIVLDISTYGKNNMKKERDFWEREAIESKAQLGEIGILAETVN